MVKIAASELPLNLDGSIYHLKLHPEQLADKCILVGDPARVEAVSSYFDSIEYKVKNRELHTHTGSYKGKRISVISTGMGTDNVDIVLNELDALCHIDFRKMETKEEGRSLELLRIGTCGALHKENEIESFVASSHALGLDGLMNCYTWQADKEESDICNAFLQSFHYPENFAKPYVVKASSVLLQKLAFDMAKGITATAFGFYGPQGRQLRIPLSYPEQNNNLHTFSYQDLKIANYEMESSALFGLGKILGHECLTICVVVANRETKTFSKDYHPAMDRLIEICLDRI